MGVRIPLVEESRSHTASLWLFSSSASSSGADERDSRRRHFGSSVCRALRAQSGGGLIRSYCRRKRRSYSLPRTVSSVGASRNFRKRVFEASETCSVVSCRLGLPRPGLFDSAVSPTHHPPTAAPATAAVAGRCALLLLLFPYHHHLTLLTATTTPRPLVYSLTALCYHRSHFFIFFTVAWHRVTPPAQHLSLLSPHCTPPGKFHFIF
jgi:hypothetical protein